MEQNLSNTKRKNKKTKACQNRILYPAKIFCKNKGKMKTLSNMQKQKGFATCIRRNVKRKAFRQKEMTTRNLNLYKRMKSNGKMVRQNKNKTVA